MAPIEPNQCYICNKLFCCQDCCSEHIKNKHFKSECTCPLCRGEPLIIRNFHHQTFLCHVVVNHLPLYCRDCGKLFQNHEDLKNLSNCQHRPLIQIEPPSSASIETSTSDVDCSSGVTKTPSNLSALKKSRSWTGSATNYFKKSPPASIRRTSTPMHVGVFKQKFNFTSKSPNILLKTPRCSIGSPPFGSEKTDLNDQQQNNQSPAESVYFDCSITRSSSDCTPLRFMLSSKILHKDISQQNFFRSITERKLEAMQESDETGLGAKDILNSSETNFNYQESRRDSKDSGKRVRFSDQSNKNLNSNECEDINSNVIDVTAAEEFFEAYESFSDASSTPVSIPKASSSVFNIEHKENFKGSEETKNNMTDEGVKESPKIKNGASRVVMMVLMEKAGDISANELSPFINSSLKKFESIVSNSSSSPLDNLPSLEDKNGKDKGLAMVSVDNYTRVSSVECFEVNNAVDIPQKNLQSVKQNNGGGIFSVMANAFKNAFKNLSGASGSKNSAHLSPKNISFSSTTSLPSPIQNSTFISRDETPNILKSRSCKRPREDNDFLSALVDKSDHENLNPLSTVRSPLQKKARRWYKQIRGRQPIARMKDNSSFSSRRISHETQRYQQGSLTVKDTILPLPSRAFQIDQSTQTDF